ncbi:MAG: TAXI family TRAP transporter solute-binding subunit [Synergistaceae bacterium]|jgi:TRAP transporter TAXI family solute receptor|nr:TAXI family TRAP transporter solute-binding subunit [Synergistaceae bacterium]
MKKISIWACVLYLMYGSGISVADPIKINIATATTGGTFYLAGIALSQLWNEKLETQTSAITSAGSPENVSLLINKEATVAAIQSDILQYAYDGIEIYKGKPLKTLRILFPFSIQNHNLIVRKGSGIDTLKDWQGKSVVLGRAGSGTFVTCEKILKAVNIKINQLNASSIGQAEAVDSIRNGLVDATVVLGRAPVPAISDAMAAPGTNVILYSMTQEEIEKITQANVWMIEDVIPARTYPNQEQEIRSTAHIAYYCVIEDFPEDLAYRLVKTAYENKERLFEVFRGYNNPAFINPAFAIKDMPVPLHIGSLKYLKEVGLIY